MVFLQVVAGLVALAGVVWVFKHHDARGEGEAGIGKFSFKNLTQGLVLVAIGVGALAYVEIEKDVDGGSGGSDELTVSEWATKANEICAEGYEEVRALNISPSEQFQAIPQLTAIDTRINGQLQALGSPSDGAAEVRQLLNLASDATVAFRDAHGYYNAGNHPAAFASYNRGQQLAAQVRDLDGNLGANVCAAGP